MFATFFRRYLGGHLGVQPESEGRWLAPKVAMLSWMLSTLLASPLFVSWSWEETRTYTRMGDFLRLCEHPFARHLREPILAYRITVPLLAHGLHLSGFPAVALSYLAIPGFLAVVFIAVRRRTDANIAQWLTVIVALSFALFWPNWMPGCPDAVTHLATACMLLTLAPHYSALALFLGLLNDERAVLALPFVALWHYPPDGTLADAWRKLKVWLGAVIVTLAIYGLFRRALSAGWIGPGLPQPTEYHHIARVLATFNPLMGSWAVWGLNVFLSFRWSWFLVVAFAAYLMAQRRWLFAGLYVWALAAACLSSITVLDVSRSVAFCFPAWLLAGVALAQASKEQTRRRLALIVAALVVTPVFLTLENFQVHWYRPLPLELIRALARWHGGQ